MSAFFISNNLHFALELLGALSFLVMAWLALDAYLIGKQSRPLLRVIGFALIGLWQIVHAFTLSADLANYLGFLVYLAGLIVVLASFFTGPRIVGAVSAVIVIPAFAGSEPRLEILAAVLLGSIAYVAFRRSKLEFDVALKPFWLGFSFLAAGSLLLAFNGGAEQGFWWYGAHLAEAAGFCFLTYWVWQYLKLRVRESMVLIFVSMTLFIATIVTLAFSTILIGKIESETKNNLLTDAKVFDFAVKGLSEEASAKSKLIAKDDNVAAALQDGDMARLENVLSRHLDEDNLGFLLAADRSGTVVLRAHALSERGDSLGGERSMAEALTGKNFTTIEFSPAEKLSIRAAAPVYQKDKIVGVVVAGYQLDNALVDGIKKVTGLDMAIYNGDTVVATTAFAPDGRSRLVGENITEDSVKDKVLSRGEAITATANIRSETFLASYLPLINSDGKVVGMLSAAEPQADILALANATNRLTLVTVTLLLLVLSLPLYFLTRRLLSSVI